MEIVTLLSVIFFVNVSLAATLKSVLPLTS